VRYSALCGNRLPGGSIDCESESLTPIRGKPAACIYSAALTTPVDRRPIRPPTTYTYDNNGNLTRVSNTATTTNYTYDYLNRMTAAGINNATTPFAYDTNGQRASMTVGTTSTPTTCKHSDARRRQTHEPL
jgi:YD repeat-containing protein